jgi:hypothetical protein
MVSDGFSHVFPNDSNNKNRQASRWYPCLTTIGVLDSLARCWRSVGISPLDVDRKNGIFSGDK